MKPICSHGHFFLILKPLDGKSTTGTYLIPVIVGEYDFYLSRYYSSCDESLYAQYAYVLEPVQDFSIKLDGHEISYASSRNKHFFTKLCHCQTYQNHEQPPQTSQNSYFQSHFSVLKFGLIFTKRKKNLKNIWLKPNNCRKVFFSSSNYLPEAF